MTPDLRLSFSCMMTQDWHIQKILKVSDMVIDLLSQASNKDTPLLCGTNWWVDTVKHRSCEVKPQTTKICLRLDKDKRIQSTRGTNFLLEVKEIDRADMRTNVQG